MTNPAQLVRFLAKAKKMQRKLSAYTYELEERGIRVVVREDREVKEIEIDGEPQPRVVELVNKAMKKAEMEAAKRMLASGQLSELLGKK